MKPIFNSKYQGLHCHVSLIMENPLVKPMEIRDERDIYKLVKDEMIASDREILLSVLMTGMNTIIGVETVAVGSLNWCVMVPREILKSAILANAGSIVVCHNHPSGELEPSQEDLKMTTILVDAAKLVGIHVLDHLIISHRGYKSILGYKIRDDEKSIGKEPEHVCEMKRGARMWAGDPALQDDSPKKGSKNGRSCHEKYDEEHANKEDQQP